MQKSGNSDIDYQNHKLNHELNFEFVSLNFFKFVDRHISDLSRLKLSTLNRIINNEYLYLDNEDQLLSFIINLNKRSNNSDYSDLYENVLLVLIGLTITIYLKFE